MGVRDPGTIREVEEVLVRRILNLDASRYSFTPGGTGAEWHEATVALSAIEETAALSHLAFNVWVEDGRNTGNERGANRNGYLWIAADVRVAFVYELRPTEQVEDLRRASDASIDIVRALMADWPADEPCINMDIPGSFYRPSLTLDGGWAVVNMAFSAEFDLRLDPSPTTTPPLSTP